MRPILRCGLALLLALPLRLNGQQAAYRLLLTDEHAMLVGWNDCGQTLNEGA